MRHKTSPLSLKLYAFVVCGPLKGSDGERVPLIDLGPGGYRYHRRAGDPEARAIRLAGVLISILIPPPKRKPDIDIGPADLIFFAPGPTPGPERKNNLDTGPNKLIAIGRAPGPISIFSLI